jgi:hypothetical protein
MDESFLVLFFKKERLASSTMGGMLRLGISAASISQCSGRADIQPDGA